MHLLLLSVVLLIALQPPPRADAATRSLRASDSVGFATIAATPSAADQATPSTTTRSVSSSSSFSSDARSCEWDGRTLRHRSATYIVGRPHRRGSIFLECDDGAISCFEDSGLVDVATTYHTTVACHKPQLLQRQRELDLEDQGLQDG